MVSGGGVRAIRSQHGYVLGWRCSVPHRVAGFLHRRAELAERCERRALRRAARQEMRERAAGQVFAWDGPLARAISERARARGGGS